MLRLALLSALLIPLAGCPAPAEMVPNPDPAVPTANLTDPDLDAARALWAAADIDAYGMTLERRCYCPMPDYTGPFRVTVRDGVLDSVMLSGARVEDERGMTVESLFVLIEEAYARDAASIAVEYHPEMGYPMSVGIDYDERIADEEIGYRVSDLAAL